MLQVSLLLLSFAGYFLLLYRLFQGKRTALYPALLVSGITALGFLAGLANCLPAAFAGMYYAGFALLPVGAVLLIRSRSRLPRPGLSDLLPFIVLAVGAYMLQDAFAGRFLYNYDDFSHWGKIARVISEELRLPVEADQLNHGTYPPGSALFLAYVARAVGVSDGAWLFANTLMLLSFWIALLDVSKRLPVRLLLLLLLVYFMHYMTPPVALYVDMLLAAAAFACLAACLSGTGKADFPLPALGVLLSAPVLIKNSGVFLAMMIALYAAYLHCRTHRRFSAGMAALLLPFALLLAWRFYCGGHLAQSTSHQMSLGHYQAVLGGKSAEDIRSTLRLILPLIIDPRENHALWLIPGYLLLLPVLRKQDRLRDNGHIFVFAAAALAAYEIGTLAMYIFSMPMADLLAHRGNDYARYNGTITALLAGLLLLLACRIRLPRFEKNRRWFAGLVCSGLPALAVGVLVYQLLVSQYVPLKPLEYRINRSQTAYHYSCLREELAVLPEDADCIVLHVEPDSGGYHSNIARYYLGERKAADCYTRNEVIRQLRETPEAVVIDLLAQRIYPPTEPYAVPDQGFTNLLDSLGYQQNTRYSVSSGKDVDAFYWDITGYLPVAVGDVIRLKNVTWLPSAENEGRGGMYWYDGEKGYVASMQTKTADNLEKWSPVFDEAGSIIQLTVPNRIGVDTVYLRICCQELSGASVITINEEIP